MPVRPQGCLSPQGMAGPACARGRPPCALAPCVSAAAAAALLVPSTICAWNKPERVTQLSHSTSMPAVSVVFGSEGDT
jgi:hypothetical protein